VPKSLVLPGTVPYHSTRGLSQFLYLVGEARRYQQIKRYAGRAGLTDGIAIDDQPEGWGAYDLDKLVHT